MGVVSGKNLPPFQRSIEIVTVDGHDLVLPSIVERQKSDSYYCKIGLPSQEYRIHFALNPKWGLALKVVQGW